MNSGRNDGQCISRRVVLTGAALALGAAATATAASQAVAQQKVSQELAKYQGTPKGNQRSTAAPSSKRRTHVKSSRATSARAVGASSVVKA